MDRPDLATMKVQFGSKYGYISYPHMGTDPEMFVKVGEKLLPAFKFLPAKEEAQTFSPVPFRHYTYDKMFWDGFQAEWTTAQSYCCLSWLVDEVQSALKDLDARAKAFNPLAELSLDNVVRLPVALLNETPDAYVQLGCKPSRNAYKDKAMFAGNPRKLRYRFAGGHMHFELKHLTTIESKKAVIKVLDKVLGVWCVGAARSFDKPVRRKYYGLAGEWRAPSYGIEYRTPSNFWLSHPITMHAVFELGRAAISLYNSGKADWWIADEDEVQSVINNCDVEGAKEILERNQELLQFILRYEDFAKPLLKMGLGGIEALVPEPRNIAKNWRFGKTWTTHCENDGCNLRDFQ